MNKQEHILSVAENLFNEFGYNAVGVDRIRDEAEVSKTSMYRHFGSKNKLIGAVLMQRHQRFEQQLTLAISPTDTTGSKLDALLDWHFAWFRSANFKGCMFMHALAEFKGHDDVIARQAMLHKIWLKSLLLTIFEAEAGIAEHKAEALMAYLEGIIVRAEFEDVRQYENVYRAAVKALACNSFE